MEVVVAGLPANVGETDIRTLFYSSGNIRKIDWSQVSWDLSSNLKPCSDSALV